jgi:hypothetical protein
VPNDQSWDAAAGVSNWLAPDEQVLWRGAPDLRPRLTIVTASAVAATVLLLTYLGAFVGGAVATDAPLPVKIFLGVIAVVWVWQLLVAPLRRRIRRRGTLYAVTTTRAVSIRRQQLVTTSTTTAPVVIRRQRDRRHGTVLFTRPEDVTLDPTRTAYDVELPSASRSRWTPRRGASTELAFHDVDHVDGFATAAQHVGYSVTTTSELGLRVRIAAMHGFGIAPARDTAAATASGANGARRAAGQGWIRIWVSTRMLRHEVRIGSPLPPNRAVDRLGNAIVAATSMQKMGFRRSNSPYTGTVSPRYVEASYFAGNNSWRWIFRGAVYADGERSTLVGKVGPEPLLPVIMGIFFAGAALSFAGGLAFTVSQLVGGHSPAALPAVGIPPVVVAVLVLMNELGYRSARAGWLLLEARLRVALDASDT